MKLPESTYQVLYMKYCGLPYDETWVNWSEDMIAEGFDKKCNDLLVLSAERSPFNEFEMKDLIESILSQLSLDTQDKEAVIRDYLKCISASSPLEHHSSLFREKGINFGFSD